MWILDALRSPLLFCEASSDDLQAERQAELQPDRDKLRRATSKGTPMAKMLREMQSRYPFLALPAHDLHGWVKMCEEAISDGEEDKAKDLIQRLEHEVELELTTLTAAFNLFKPPGKTALAEKEIKTMLDYLGFPSDPSSVEQLLAAVDTDHDRTMSLVEFQQYVGRMGGSFRLFEVRRQQMEARHGHGSSGATMDASEIRMQLLEAGIRDDAQAYWHLVVPPSEFQEAAKLVTCQKEAIRHIRALAKAHHDEALPKLQLRVKKLGHQDTDLWMCLAWIRELAPILVHVNLTKMIPFMEGDTHYRNQFETRSSGGLLKPEVRVKWERDLFGGCYDKASNFDRCKYGVLNAMNDHRGVVRCSQYGDSYLVLRDCRLRCTFSPEDSANLKADRLAVLDYYAHVLNEYSDEEISETMKVAKSSASALLGDSSKVGAMKYKETQIHGEVSFSKHVERLVAHSKHRDNPNEEKRLKAICAKHGWKFSWMDEERRRMEREEIQKLGADAWKKRLKELMEKGTPDAAHVAPGCCKKGCGRAVAPGTTRSGKAFDTCCRGCVMGFGHDLTCGNIDPQLLGAGKCKNGCGRDVNAGTHPSGRPYDTCCRGCSSGHHDVYCGSNENNEPPPPKGFCRMRCGRPVAKSNDGRVFDTCCRACATGEGHTDTCKETSQTDASHSRHLFGWAGW